MADVKAATGWKADDLHEAERPFHQRNKVFYVVTNWGEFNELFRTRRNALAHILRDPEVTKHSWRTLYEIRRMRLIPFMEGRAEARNV